MPIALLIPEYFVWHYVAAPRLCLNIVTNFIWFTGHFFSMPVLARTLFAPWHQIHESYRSGFHPAQQAEAVLVNFIMRLVGFAIRSVVLIFGTALCVAVAIFGLAVFLAWLVLPLAVIVLFFASVRILLS